MGGVLDFLFEGKPPPSVTSYGTSSTNLPSWLNDYTQGLLARANATAAEPYPTYGAPRIAGFTPQQKKGFDTIDQTVGAYKPFLDQAGALTQAAGNTDIVGAAAPYMEQAGKRLPGNVQEYMDPYVGNVINRAELEANRNFKENIMPTISGKFISGGQYGSSAHQREADRAARDLTEGLQSTSLGALSQAYNQAGTQFQSDQAREAQLAGTAGQLAGTNANLQLAAGKQQGALGQASQALGLEGAQALEASGAAQQGQNQRNLDLAYQDFLQQRDYPKSQVDWLSNIIRGVPSQSTTNSSQTGPLSGAKMGPSTAAELGSIVTAGKGIWDIFNSDSPSTPVAEARGGRIRRPVFRSRGGLTLAFA
jgi:hypothetical protein